MTLQEYNDLFKQPLMKKMHITASGGNTITNTNIVSEKMSLEKSLCSDDNLRYGRCEAACFKITIADVNHDFTGEWLTVVMDVQTDSKGYLIAMNGDYVVTESGDKIKLNDADIEEAQVTLGRFKVYSDRPTNDRRWRELTCYDAMYDILNADVADWYNALTFPMTIKNLRDSLFTHLGITQETVTLVNDSFSIPQKGFSVIGTLSGKTVIEAICEFNGCFGQITPSGTFDYVSLSDADTLTLDYYVDGTGSYEDYVTAPITGVNARGTASDVGTFVGTDTNVYVLIGNPLIYGTEGTQALETALTNLLNHIDGDSFRPFEVQAYGNPALPLGTQLTVVTRDKTIVSYVIRKTMTGIQALRDRFRATSEKTQPPLVNNVKNEIIRVQGKEHQLEINVDGLTSRVTYIENNYASEYELQLTADGILSTVSRSENKYDESALPSGVEINYYGYGAPSDTQYPPADNNGKYYLDNQSGQVYSCNGTAWSTYGDPLTLITDNLQSSITQNANEIVLKTYTDSQDVKHLAEVALSATPTSASEFKVSADNVTFIANNKFELTTNNLEINSTYFKVASDGSLTSTKGKIANWDINAYYLGSKYENGNDYYEAYIQAFTGSNLSRYAFAIDTYISGTLTHPFYVSYDGKLYANNAEIAGKITATSGKIANWDINPYYFGSKYESGSDYYWAYVQAFTGSSTSRYAFAIDTKVNGTVSSPFYVTYDGSLHATKATIEGTVTSSNGTIGGWTLASGKIYGGDSSLGVAVMQKPSVSTNWTFASGGTSHSDYGSCPFRVRKNGDTYVSNLYVTNATGYQNIDISTPYTVAMYALSSIARFYLTGSSSSTEYVHLAPDNDSYFAKDVYLMSNFRCYGTKNRVVKTEDYGDRLMYCYETPTPMFGDIGEGKIAEDGKCYVWLDSKFSETIKTQSYQVFLQKYGQGECYVSERTERYFVVEGTADLNFGWEIKARQIGYENMRLEDVNTDRTDIKTINYGATAIEHINSLKIEREVA